MNASLIERCEAGIRRFFSRLGGALDRTIGGISSFDLSALVPLVEQAIEEGLRKQNGRIIAPNRIELRYDYETFAQLTRDQIDYLRREIRSNATEYIFNRRYSLEGEVKVDASFDPFAKRLRIETTFDEEAQTSAKKTAKVGDYGVILRLTSRGLPPIVKAELASGTASAAIGRSRDNAIVIDHASVSNFHASFTRTTDDNLWLADLESSNGTFLNGSRVIATERKAVRTGDRLRFGEVEAILEIIAGKTGSN